MLCGDRERLEDHLVHLLSGSVSATAEQLMQQLKVRGLSYSIQAVYMELRKLQAEGVVIKARGLYSLRLSWVFNLTDFADRAYATCVDAPLPDELLPSPGKKIRWNFSNLVRADSFYLQVITKLLIDPAVSAVYTVIDHPWFLFMQNRDEAKYRDILRHQIKRHFLLVENGTPLDRQQLRFYDTGENRPIAYAFSDEFNLSKTASLTSFLGDFVVYEKLPSLTRAAFESIYTDTPSLNKVDYARVIRLLTSHSPASVILERNETKAKRWIKKLSEYLPLPSPAR